MTEIQREARRRGIPWAWVRAEFRELWSAEHAKREHANEVRQYAWHQHAHDRYAKFWTHGFQWWYGGIADASDYSYIPGYDTLSRIVGKRFPEWRGRTEELWHFLLSPYAKLPERESIYWKALENVSALSEADAALTNCSDADTF